MARPSLHTVSKGTYSLLKQKNTKKRGFLSALMVLGLGVLFLVADPASALQAQSPTKLTLIESNQNRIVLELVVPKYESRQQTVRGVAYSVLTAPGLGVAGEVGKPQLPIIGTLIGIPPGAKPTLRVVQDDSRRDSLTVRPIPVPRTRVRLVPEFSPSSEEHVFTTDAATYSGNRPYPSDVVTIGSPRNWRSQTVLALQFRPLQYDPAARQVIFHRRIRVEITLNYPSGLRADAAGQAVSEGKFEDVLQGAILNHDTAKNWRSQTGGQRGRAASTNPYVTGSWYKVPVGADGIYQIRCDRLPSGVDSGTLRVFKNGSEIAINVVGGSWSPCQPDQDYLEFFGQATNSKYSTTNTYWLTFARPDLGSVKRMVVRPAGTATQVAGTLTDTIPAIPAAQRDVFYASYTPHVEDYDHWFAGYVKGGTTKNYPFTIDRLPVGGASGALTVALAGFSDPNFGSGSGNAQIYLNGNLVGNSSWSGNEPRNATFALDPSLLINGSNTVSIQETGGAYDYTFVDEVEVSYGSVFSTTTNLLRFRQPDPGAWQYQIHGFTNLSIEVFDITNPVSVTRVVTSTTSPPLLLVFNDTIGEPHEYLALAAGQRTIVSSIELDTPSNLHAETNAADYIIISPGEFQASLQPLLSFRASQGFRTKFVDLQDIYDEFNDGVPDAQAIRDMLEYAYGHWQGPKPSYVLLVGDGTFDPKYNCVTPKTCINAVTVDGSTHLPPYLRMVDPTVGERPSDTQLVAFGDGSGNPVPYMAVGRLPANSASQVTAMVNKITGYEQNPPSPDWRGRITFVADSPYDAGGTYNPLAGDFWLLSDEIASDPTYVPPPVYSANRDYYNPCPLPQCNYTPYNIQPDARNALFAAFQNGSLFISYAGHGAVTGWSNDALFLSTDVAGLDNSRLPVMLEMTCETGNFSKPKVEEASLAETLVGAANEGAVASWAATGRGLAVGHNVMEQGFLSAMMWQNKTRLGPAIIAGYAQVYASGSYLDLIDTFLLLGDPATRVNIYSHYNLYLPSISR